MLGTISKMKKLMLLLSTAVLVAGCQTAPHSSSTRVLDNSTFMSLWGTYQRCMNGSDLEQLRVDLSALMNAPHSHTSPSDFRLPLPDLITRHMSVQPSRIAADPKALAAACSLHTADVARESGKNEVAAELLNGLLRTHSSGEYAFYLQQAKVSLTRMQPTAIHVSRSGRTEPEHSLGSSAAPAMIAPPTPIDSSDILQYD